MPLKTASPNVTNSIGDADDNMIADITRTSLYYIAQENSKNIVDGIRPDRNTRSHQIRREPFSNSR